MIFNIVFGIWCLLFCISFSRSIAFSIQDEKTKQEEGGVFLTLQYLDKQIYLIMLPLTVMAIITKFT